jgi:hypothetical protein
VGSPYLKLFGSSLLSTVVPLREMIREHDALLAQPALRRGTGIRSPTSPAPMSKPYTSLLKTACPVVVIPPRPAPKCHNTYVHPTFEWGPQSLVPSLALAQRSCSPSSIPIFYGDDRTYVHPSIPPYPLPRPTDVAPISRVLLIVVWVLCRSFVGHILATIIPAKLIVRVAGTRRLWGSMHSMAALLG